MQPWWTREISLKKHNNIPTPNVRMRSGLSPCLSRPQVFFRVTVGMSRCPVDGGDRDVVMSVRPVGFNESVSVRIRQMCVCGCAQTGRCHDEPDPSDCPAETSGCRAHCSGRGVCTWDVCVWLQQTGTHLRQVLWDGRLLLSVREGPGVWRWAPRCVWGRN